MSSGLVRKTRPAVASHVCGGCCSATKALVAPDRQKTTCSLFFFSRCGAACGDSVFFVQHARLCVQVGCVTHPPVPSRVFVPSQVLLRRLREMAGVLNGSWIPFQDQVGRQGWCVLCRVLLVCLFTLYSQSRQCVFLTGGELDSRPTAVLGSMVYSSTEYNNSSRSVCVQSAHV